MNRVWAAIILGIVSFLFSITGPLALLLAIPGLLLGISGLKLPAREISIPVGYKGKLGRKTIKAQPFLSTKYLVFMAIGINAFAGMISLLAAIPFLFFFLATR